MSDTQEQVNICALMTAGRYENTWCRNNMEYSFRKLGIPLIVSGGVYYGQCMQIMMEDAIRAGVEYILTVDGDSVFTPKRPWTTSLASASLPGQRLIRSRRGWRLLMPGIATAAGMQ